MSDGLKKGRCSGCGCVTNLVSYTYNWEESCGQPLCDDCTHVDKRYSWTHEPNNPLVERLRDAVNGEHDMTPHGADILQAIDRIEELEAQLAKAAKVLDDFIRLDEDYSPFGGEIMQDRVERTWDNARTTLAELKGQDNGY